VTSEYHQFKIRSYTHWGTPRTFHGIEFVDPNPKGNYAPYPKKDIRLDTLLRIRDDIRAKLRHPANSAGLKTFRALSRHGYFPQKHGACLGLCAE
jgi:hypothetical protein